MNASKSPSRRAFLQNLGMGAAALATAPWLHSEAALSKPNVLYLLADDLGWGDLGVHRGSIPTPNIDGLFRDGVELRQFMGWPVCSPTRAMFLTGRHPFRVGTGPETGGELEAGETTIAEAFKSNGYATGIFGKWHNGEDPDTAEYRMAFDEAWKNTPQKRPVTGLGVNAHGFDEAWVYYGGGADYFTRRTVGGRGPVSWWHNREYRPQDVGYTEDLITQHVLDFLRAHKDHPFFCYVPFHIVHAPLQAKDSDLAGVDAAVTEKTKRTYAAMVAALDRNIGTILAELDRLGLRENTIIVVTSDNGATRDGSNLPLRGGKHTLYDGGVRLPTAIQYRRGGLAGGKSWDGLCGALDMFPTLVSLAGLTIPPTRPLDGKNILPAMRVGGESPVESYYWAWGDHDAVRTREWKLLRYFDRVELYNIRADEAEAVDLAAEHPAQVRVLTTLMDSWVASLGAALSHQPSPAPLDAAPMPDGEALEISFTVTAAAKPKDVRIIPFAGNGGPRFATDRVEYDVSYLPGPGVPACFYSPFRGNDDVPMVAEFRRGVGIDQFGREQSRSPAPRGGAGSWEHRIIGVGGGAPGPMLRHGLVIGGGKPGTFKVYLANLRMRRMDGSTVPIWTGESHTRWQKIKDSGAFTDVQYRVVKAKELGFSPGVGK